MLALGGARDYPLGHPGKPLVFLKEVHMATGAILQLALADPVKVDPKRYKVEFENSVGPPYNVGPHEKTPMHEHPASVAVWLSDENSKHTFGDGKTEERHTKAGQTFWGPAAKYMAENLSDKRIELILVS